MESGECSVQLESGVGSEQAGLSCNPRVPIPSCTVLCALCTAVHCALCTVPFTVLEALSSMHCRPAPCQPIGHCKDGIWYSAVMQIEAGARLVKGTINLNT